MDKRLQELIWKVIDRSATQDEFNDLQQRLRESAEAQDAWLAAVHLSESLKDSQVERFQKSSASTVPEAADTDEGMRIGRSTSSERSPRESARGPRMLGMLMATVLLVAVAVVSFQLGNRQIEDAGGTSNDANAGTRERLIAGHATLRRAVGMDWGGTGSTALREGDLLTAGPLSFESGLAEIDFFCGATVLVEGPARLQIESDWSLIVNEGRLRVTVPPAAQGFVVKAADSEIVDLGTEFAVDVTNQQAAVKVIDGEVRLQGGPHDGQLLTTGQQQSLSGTSSPLDVQHFQTLEDVRRRHGDEASQRFQQWRNAAAEIARDERLIAFYPIAGQSANRTIQDTSANGEHRNGQVIGPAESVDGRFGTESWGLSFRRPGARVRTRIDGTFEAFTFAAWVRIDSLEHRYNALFMGDGYENGEPHWQIRDDGRLMFSVMVDDSQDIRHFNQIDQQVVRDAGLHRVYMTEPIWDLADSGRWFHLAAVYDPGNQIVRQFVNGRLVSEEKIPEKFHVTKLHIGPAEIGNWGQPFRRTPWFAVRNLNGIIDELAIFDAALAPNEIEEIYESGRPPGY